MQVNAQTVIFSEDFQGGLAPGWTQNTSASDGGWMIGNAAFLGSTDFSPPAHTIFAGTNDDACICNKILDRFIMPVQNFTANSAVYLEADIYFLEGTYLGTTESAYIDVSTDSGSTWTHVQTIAGSNVWNRLTVNLSAYKGIADVLIGFHYSDKGAWLYGLCVDDIELHTLMTLTPSPVSCFRGSDGTISLTISAVTAPYTYLWSNGDTSQNLLGVTAGTYSVIITDINGDITLDSATITAPPVWLISLTTVDVSCYGGSDGSIDLTVTGGIPPYTYLWSNGATTEDISDLTADIYEVTVTQSDSCTLVDSAVITEPDPLITNLVVNNESSAGTGDGSADLTVTGGILPYLFSWSNSATTEDITGVQSGTYTVTIVDANFCVAYDTAFIVTTSIKSLQSKDSKFTIYPNPTDGQFIIKVRDGSLFQIRIYNLQGQLVLYEELTNASSITVNMSSYQAGLYFIQITTDKISIIKKIVLE